MLPGFQDSEFLLQISCVLVCEVAENTASIVDSVFDSWIYRSGG